MPVTNDQALALRTLLTGDIEKYNRLFAQLDRAAALKGYTALIAAAFCEAVERRFPKDFEQSDVVAFVADVRSRSDRLANALDPRTAERIIRVVFGDGSVRDVDDATTVRTQIVLLTALIADEELDDNGLDAFMDRARKLADQMIN
jgi:hypothetical protein